MGGYLVLAWPPGRPSDEARVLRQALLAQGWRVVHDDFGLLVLVRGSRPPPVQVLPGRRGVVVGEVHDTEATRAGHPEPFDVRLLSRLDALDAATVLSRCAWGRYVAVFTSRDAPPAVFRDPMGGLESLVWRCGAVTLVGDDPPISGPAAPPGLAIDWARAADLLADIALASGPLCLAGVESLTPGEIMLGDGARQLVWTPAAHAWRRGGPDAGQAAVQLRRTVENCVRTLAAGRTAIVAEVSGGLDSSLVGLLLGEIRAPVAAVTNLHWPHLAGDERRYAAAVAERLGVAFTEIARGDLRFAPADLEPCVGLRPPFNAQDAAYDADMAQRLIALDADALFTGHGGDVVFYQMPEPALARAVLAGASCGVGPGRALGLLAQRLRTHVWRLLLEALGPAGRDPPGLPAPRYLTRRSARAPHPWLADLRGIGGAKRVQIRALTNTLMLRGPSRRGAVADLVDPLLSQPVVELGLALPGPLLAIGDHDRPLARAAFADLLPPILRQRRGKGDVTAVFARSLAASLDVLRPWLLDGRLVGEGLIDPARLEPLLDPEVLIWRDHTGEIMRAVIVEAWARAWETRLAAARADQPSEGSPPGALTSRGASTGAN